MEGKGVSLRCGFLVFLHVFFCLFDDAETQDPIISFHIVSSLSGGGHYLSSVLGFDKDKEAMATRWPIHWQTITKS